MAARATHWLDLCRAKDELRIPQEVGEYDTQIRKHIEDAVAFLERRLDLPLLDRSLFLDTPPCIPLVLARLGEGVAPGIQHLKTVDAMHVRMAHDQPYSVAVAPGPNPVLEAASPRRSTTWRYWPDVDLPSGAQSVRVTVTVGMDAFDPQNEQIRSAVILLVRDLFEGLPVAERRPAWERMIEQTVLGSGGAS